MTDSFSPVSRVLKVNGNASRRSNYLFFFFENLLLIFGFIVWGINQEIMKVVPLCKDGVKKQKSNVYIHLIII